jgi:hypothetical protein
MKENKSLVQEALIQMKQVEEAIAENAKGILASTMKKEINQLVKESLSEQEEEDEIDLDTDANADVDNDDIDMDSDVEDIDSDEEDMDYDEEDMYSDEEDMDMDMDSDESPIDLTDASDEEILKVFKAMGEDDGIIVKKDGENVYLSDDDANVEYLVKLGESYKDKKNNYSMRDEQDESVDDVINAIFSDSGDVSDVDSDDLDGEETETLYEIEMGEPEKVETIYELALDDDNLIPIDEEDGEDGYGDNGFNQFNMDEEDGEDGYGDNGFNQFNMDEEDGEDGYGDNGFNQFNMDEEDGEDGNNGYYNETYKPKGVGIGLGPKFSYKNKTNGGFNEKRKQGPKSVGTGKPKFEYKKGENMGAKSKIVKAETKEGQGYKDKEDERLSMKHGKIASKDIKTTKGRRDDADFEKSETKEAARTYGMGSKEGRGLRKGITNNRNYVYSNSGVKTESTQEEVRMLRGKNEEYRKALNVFREKLNEVAIFNSNLAYATRLFTEHSTTKKEKINILRRFDDVETLKESKNLYRSLKDELTSTDTKSINESVTTKLNKSVSTGSSTTLIESKTYENPQFLRMKDLMGKLG